MLMYYPKRRSPCLPEARIIGQCDSIGAGVQSDDLEHGLLPNP